MTYIDVFKLIISFPYPSLLWELLSNRHPLAPLLSSRLAQASSLTAFSLTVSSLRASSLQASFGSQLWACGPSWDGCGRLLESPCALLVLSSPLASFLQAFSPQQLFSLAEP